MLALELLATSAADAMGLAISRRAAPDMRISCVCELARARGLVGIELSEADLGNADALNEASGFVVGIHVQSRAALASARTPGLAAALRAPVIAAHRAFTKASIADLDALYRREGAELLLSHRTAVFHAALLVEAVASAGASSVSIAWDIHAKRDDLRAAPGVLLATAGTLRYIRMRGGGPELSEDEAGIGDLMASVALSGFAGVMTLAPSSDDRIDDWQNWLAGHRKSGCGTAYEKKKSREGASRDDVDRR